MKEGVIIYECRKCCEYEDDIGCIFKVVSSHNKPTKCPLEGENIAEWIDIEFEDM
jgi:hypothetical protein